MTISVLAALAFGSRVFAQSQDSPAASSASRHPLAVVTLPEMGNFQFVALGDLAEFLDLRTFYSEKARKVILYVGGMEVKVTAMNPFVQIGDRVVQLPLETRYANGDILVPLRYFTDLLRPLYPKAWPAELDFSKAPDNPPVVTVISTPPAPAAPKPEITAISKILVEQKANGTLIRIQTTRPFNRKTVSTRLSQRWLYVDVIGSRIDSGAARHVQAAGIVQRVLPLQVGAVAQVSCQLKEDIDHNRIVISGQGNEILVSLPTGQPLPTEVLRNLENERRKWLIDTIVLDPGHGGHDPGAIGANGVHEKNVTLGIAKRLKRLLEKNLDVRVVMTREDDRFVPLKDRTQLANSVQGKIFISIHCNSNLSRRVNGATTYFLGPAKTEEALEVARLENSVIRYEPDSSAYAGLGAESFILAAMAQNAFNRESEDLAAMVQEELSSKTKLANRGVKQAGYYVLIGASMPNILIETAFISNPRESTLLNDASFQQDLAEAIFNSIKKFKEKYEWGI
ncbi:MAG: N-acetylmuramoyl-L-alanine amidase [candidate division KSB1 bacterium]|nr:N-acetylmuramoyl-L-alanine amidase [candidate division KSB1 bacterium]MDZ7302448.1 N-acetylmuramoyl-L-alanine amidase [candidate division KSB1 bacterium]MDZ7311958.1 N-acetylmuramoyl-L-alanine amidase [candidate division KSB1 bacterium]